MRVRVAGLIELVAAFAGALAMRNMGNPVPPFAKAAISKGGGLTIGVLFLSWDSDSNGEKTNDLYLNLRSETTAAAARTPGNGAAPQLEREARGAEGNRSACRGRPDLFLGVAEMLGGREHEVPGFGAFIASRHRSRGARRRSPTIAP
jgi:hypothetical protein